MPQGSSLNSVSSPPKTRLERARYALLPGALLLLILAVLISLMLGAVSISLKELLSAFSGASAGEERNLSALILWRLRLPRILMAVIAGFGLGISGAAMQGILRNPLVSPFTLGISSAAGFGAAAAIVFGGESVKLALFSLGLPIAAAFLCALVSMAAVLALSRLTGGAGKTVILAGIAVMYLFSAGTSILQYAATSEELSRIVFWMMGSLSAAQWWEVAFAGGILLLSAPVLYLNSWNYTILAMGDDASLSVGVDPRKTTRITIVLCALLTAGIISLTGVIGFIGLVAPHIARMILGNDYRFLLPASGLFGALLLVAADTLSRTLLAPAEFPIGIMTAFLGVPFFLYLLIRASRLGRE